MDMLIVSFLSSLAAVFLIVRSSRGTSSRILDVDQDGPQKFHSRPVPRVGGVGLLVGLAAGAIWMFFSRSAGLTALLVVACGLPAFAAGLVEDLTKRINPTIRLIATLASALLASWVVGSTIRYSAIPGLDFLLAIPAAAVVLTAFAVTGVANSFNIIDGFNGLAAMCAVMMLACLAWVAFQVGDAELGLLAVVGCGAVLGFFVFNFPAGHIFLGDGGAYLLGFFVAEVAILLIGRHPQVSPMFPLLLCAYPIFETLFSIYRKKYLRGTAATMPDGIHLHMLVYKRLMRWDVGSRDARALTHRNSMTSPYLWILCLTSVVPAALWWRHTWVMLTAMAAFALIYCVAYWRIVRFRVPRWMVVRIRY
jgi:UDP-N-acetylmuramyl pentapeptide phosphotransferase/UDP-N-acetylglucosamine-1-phosphate transferase